MYIISLTYKVPTEEVDPYLDAHISFLNEQYANGTFLASGRKVPRTGGIILAQSESKEKLQKIVEQDPFYEYGIADIEIIEFNVTKAATGFENLLD
ncbi:MAG TPA: YciI family protein [Sunxiuqinia sp.]|nr:YciI family protein [Sunxiuqinia sp.]